MVVAVHPEFHAEPLDPALRDLVPSDVQVVETGAIPQRWTAWMGLRGEIGLRGFFHLRAEIARQMTQWKPKVVMITGSPFYPMLLSGWIRRCFGIPVVLDLQDPWVSKEGSTRRHWTKGWLAHHLAVMLEPRALKNASWITSVSERQNDELGERYPWLDRRRMTAIPIGGDPADFEAVRASVASSAHPGTSKHLQFSYVGTALPRATPLLRILFEGLARLKHEQPVLARRIQLRFVGTSNQPGRSTDYRVLPIAHQVGIAAQVIEEPGRVPFLEALRILATTNSVLMVGSDEPHYTASKIYPGLMSGRPFLSLFHEDSSAHDILARSGGGVALAYTVESSRDALILAVANGFASLASGTSSFPVVSAKSYGDYTAHTVAGRYADVFSRLTTAAQPVS